MLRRNFARWLSTSIIPFFLPKFARAQASGLTDAEAPAIIELAAVVLPESLGRTRIDEIAKQFVRWTQGYKPGADAGYGYGFPILQVLGANPATSYPGQLNQLESAAITKGGSFVALPV